MNEEAIILQKLKQGNRDLEWFSKNYSDLKKKYPKKFVAVKDRRIVMVESKLENLLDKLRKRYGDTKEFLIDFLPDEGYVLVV